MYAINFKYGFSYVFFSCSSLKEILYHAKVRISIFLQALDTVRRKMSLHLTVGIHSWNLPMPSP